MIRKVVSKRLGGMGRTTEFQKKPIPWMYSTLGSMVAIALMKLAPIHRRLTELEIKNIQDYFSSDFVDVSNRKHLSKFSAFLMTYFNAIRRIAQVSRAARQDYYALNRRGSFAVASIPKFDKPQNPNSSELPVLIVPGLNTPPMFFREMYSYFVHQGYNVSVLELPERGLADVSSSAIALQEEMDRMRERCEKPQVNVVGHCLGGLIAKYCLEFVETPEANPSVRNLVSLGTGFMGAEGVQHLKNIWIPKNPGKPVPKVFDELIQWNLNVAKKSGEVAYHSLLTIWDFMVYYRKGFLENPGKGLVANRIIDDPAIDHLTIALNHRVFQEIEKILQADPLLLPAAPRALAAT
jgi:pimeloyl-ACP methyl ester carboxylesterase